MQIGSTSAFEGHLKAAVSSKKTGRSHAGWPRKLILFRGIKGISAPHSPVFEERNGLHMKLQNAHMANKAGQISVYWQNMFSFPSFHLFNDDGNEAK